VLGNPLRGGGGALSWPAALVAAGLVAAVTAVVLHPAWAVPVGAATLASARWPRWRALLTVGALWGVVLTAQLYLARVVIAHPAPGFGWVSRFEFGNRLAVTAVLLLVADAVVERLRPRTDPPDIPWRHISRIGWRRRHDLR
jgi:hypothetical protein